MPLSAKRRKDNEVKAMDSPAGFETVLLARLREMGKHLC